MRDRGIVILLFGVMFASATETAIMAPILPQLAAELGVAVDRAAWCVTAYVVATGASAIVFGPVSDRLGRKIVLAWGMGALALGTLLCGLAGSLAMLLVARSVCGVGAGMLVTSTTSYVSDHFPAERRAEVMTHVMNGALLALVLGIPAGAFLTAALGWSAMFFAVSALLFALFFAVVLGLPSPGPAVGHREHERERGSRSNRATAGYLELLGRRPVWAFLAMIGTNGVSMTMFSLYLSAWMAEAFGFATEHRGLVYAIAGPAVLVGAPIAARLSNRFGRVPIVVVGALLVATSIAVLPSSPAIGAALASSMFDAFVASPALVGRTPWPEAVPLFIIAFFVLLGGATRGGPLHTFALERVPSSLRGTLSALGNACFQAGAAIGATLGGALWSGAASFRTIALVAAALNVLAAALFALLARGEEVRTDAETSAP